MLLRTALPAALGLCAACAPDSPAPPEEAARQFVGSGACAACHPDETAQWRGSHHDLAMRKAGEDSVLGDFDAAEFAEHAVRWSFHERDGKYVARAREAEQGEFEITHTFGFDPLQQYLVTFDDGRVQALTVAWDARPAPLGGQRWFSLHGDVPVRAGDPLHWRGPAQRWNLMCGECHSTGFEKRYRAETDSYESSFAEINVACEACHGPAGAHVAAPEANGFAVQFEAPSDWVRAPGARIASRASPRVTHAELETCAPCHSRRAPITERHTPGTPFLDGFQPTLLETGLYFPDGQIRGEVYVYGSFLQSRMYARGVTCSDCHEPHSLSLRAAGNALCGRCHEPSAFDTESHHHHVAGTEGAACVSCHMPARTYMQVDDRRDHSFPIPRPDLTQRLGTPNACTQCHAALGADWAARRVADWRSDRMPRRHFGELLHMARGSGVAAAAARLELAVDPEAPGIARASALSLMADRAVPNSSDQIAAASRDSDALVRAAAARATAGLDPAARPALVGHLLEDPRRAVRIEAGRVLAGTPTTGALDRAVGEYRAAQRAHSDRPSAHVDLALLHLQQGNPELAERAYVRALSVGPDFLPAYVNLADLYRMLNREDEGELLLRKALTLAEDDAAVHHALGLLLVRTRRLNEALPELAIAAKLAPEEPRYALGYSVALHSAGHTDQALTSLRAARERHPGEPALLRALATISRDAGGMDEALRHARALEALLPDDAGARALRRELETARAR